MTENPTDRTNRRRLIYVQQRIEIIQQELAALRAEREDLKTLLANVTAGDRP